MKKIILLLSVIGLVMFGISSPSFAYSSVKSSGYCSNFHSYYTFTMERKGSTVSSVLEVYPANPRARWDLNMSYDAPTPSDRNISAFSDKYGRLKVSHSHKSVGAVRTIWVANYNNQIFCIVGGTI